MYQIIYTKSGHKRGAKSINEVGRILTRIMYNRREAKAYEVQTGELIGRCYCINPDKDYWRVTLNGEKIRESRVLQLCWLEELQGLAKNSFLFVSKPAPEIRAILNRKHPGKYHVDSAERGCQVYHK